MQTFGAFLVAILAAGDLVAAIPARMDVVKHSKRTSNTVSLPVKRNAACNRNGALALARTYKKFNTSLPDHLQTIVAAHKANLVAKRTTGSAVTTPGDSYDSEYLTTIQVGTPAQSIPMDFDTGSSDLWLFSSETASSDVNGQTVYDITASTTASKMTGASWSISYGDGSSSSGNVYTDVVTIGNFTVQAQAVESATQVSDEFTSDSTMSGLVGLGFSSINTVSPTAQKTFFDNAMSSLNQPLFTADLKHQADGRYNFGYIDTTAYTGDMFYTDVDSSSGYWGFTATGYAVGNGTTTTSSSGSTTSSGSSTSGSGSSTSGSGSSSGHGGGGNGNGSSGGGRGSSNSAGGSGNGFDFGGGGFKDKTKKRAVTITDTSISGIADTGTTLLMLPDTIVSAYYAQVDSAENSRSEGGFVFPCDADLPDFTFAVGDGTITIPGTYMNYAPVDEAGTSCYGGLQSSDDIGINIFGDVALKAAFVVFNGDTLQLGWAAKTLS